MKIVRRSQIAISLVLAAFMLLGFRLAQIQVFAADEYRAAGARQRRTTETITVPRGEILDTRRVPLAHSEPGFELWAEPAKISDCDNAAKMIAEVLHEDAATVLARFWQARDRVLVARDISLEQTRELKSRIAAGLKGLRLEEGARRVYPLGKATSQLLGIVGRDGEGLEGLEYAWEQTLAGRPGRRELSSDARGRRMDLGDGAEVPSQRGANLVLTIDAALQNILFEEMDRQAALISPKSGAGVILDPATCDIRAIVSWPSYEPAARGRAAANTTKNRPIMDVLEPGSTFKSFIVARALDAGVIRTNDTIDCENGAWRAFKGRVVHDTHPMGIVLLEKVLIHSSNIALAKIGQRLGADRLHESVVAFGFGRKTEVGLPGESRGLVRPRAAWSPHTVISVPFGQELAVTPLQLATGYAALVNGGLKFRPRVIDRLEDANGALLREFPRLEPERVVTEATSAWMRQTLLKVVEEGTGRKAHVDGLAIGGKTGTSQTYERDPATGKMRISSTKVIASFVGFAPADHPSLLCVVMWDEPQTKRYGGSAAGPVVARVFKRAFLGTKIVGGPKGGGPRS